MTKPEPTIFFDARWTKFPRHDGISRFGASLLEALAKQASVTMLICDERQLALLPHGVPHIMLNDPQKFWQELFVARKLNRLGADVVYSPTQVMGTWGRRYKLIFTLHDVIYYKYPFPPTYLPAIVRLAWWLYHQAHWPGRFLLNRADVVATVSKTSKVEITERHLTDRPIEVVYNAPTALPKVELAAPKKEIVFMGTLMPYKNAELLIDALPLLREYHLHLPGRVTPDRLAALTARADRLGVTKRITFWKGASDADYAKMLSTAMASVSASKAEGFGLPVIEAMALGVPFLATNMPIFHEVGGDAALYFNPDNPADFAAKVRQVEDPATRKGMVERGYAQAAKFSWEQSAATLLHVIRGLASRS
jgi:glycosyltransferase involved in cell wall biosynthesis